MAGKAAHISGIVARGNTLTIHLVAPGPGPGLAARRASFLLFGPDRDAARSEGRAHGALGRALLRRPRTRLARGRADAESELPRKPATPSRADRGDRERRSDEDRRRDRGRQRRLQPDRRRSWRRTPGSPPATARAARRRAAGASSTSSTQRSGSTTSSSTPTDRCSKICDSGRPSTSRSTARHWLEIAPQRTRTRATDRPVPALRPCPASRTPTSIRSHLISRLRDASPGDVRGTAVLYTCNISAATNSPRS